MKEYGPYVHTLGYIFYVQTWCSGRKKTVLQHRRIMEKKLGRKLKKTEAVHHLDGDASNNRVSNLRVMNKTEHLLLHGETKTNQAAVKLTCLWCAGKFKRRGCEERDHRKQGKHGPFCGKSCAGSWSRKQQLKRGLKNLRQLPVAKLENALDSKSRY